MYHVVCGLPYFGSAGAGFVSIEVFLHIDIRRVTIVKTLSARVISQSMSDTTSELSSVRDRRYMSKSQIQYNVWWCSEEKFNCQIWNKILCNRLLRTDKIYGL